MKRKAVLVVLQQLQMMATSIPPTILRSSAHNGTARGRILRYLARYYAFTYSPHVFKLLSLESTALSQVAPHLLV